MILPKPEPFAGSSGNVFTSSLTAWREIRDLVTIRPYQLVLLALLGAAVGLAETAFLGVIASVGVALAGDNIGSVKLPVGSLDDISIPALLGIGAAAAVATLAAQILIVVTIARNESRTVRQLRIETYRDFVNTSWAVQRGEVEGVFLSYIVSYIPRVAGVMSALTTELTAAFTLLVFVAGAVLISPLIAFAVIAFGALLFVVFLPARGMSRRAGQEATRATRKLYGSFVSAVSASREIKSYGVEAAVRQRIDGEIADLERPTYRARLLKSVVPAIYVRVVFLILLGGLAWIYAVGVNQLTSLGAALLLVLRAMQQAQFIQSQEQTIAESRPWISDLMLRRNRFRDNVITTGDAKLEGVDEIEFDNVTYRYGDDVLALDGVSFTAKRGELIGLIGPSGSGKSTLSELAVRLDRPTSGNVRVNGRDVWDYDHASWTEQVVLVPQMSQLIGASVADNIRFLRADISEQDVREAARRAHLTDEITELEDGFDTVVGDRGYRGLSGGQRQRLSIARAVARPPSLVVLDEPTSALDHKAEEVIVRTIEELRQHACVLVVAHRISTLRHCDRVLVLREGKPEAFCSLDELPEKSPFFRVAQTSTEF